MILHLKLNGDATDASGNDVVCTPNGGTYVSGVIGQAFDGGGAYRIALPNDYPAAMGGAAGCTFACWLKRAATGPGYLINLTVSGNYGKFIVNFNPAGDDKIIVGGRSKIGDAYQSVTTTSAFADTTQWHHLAAVVSPSTNQILVYWDGVPQATTGTVSFGQTTFSADVGNAGTQFLLANYQGNTIFNGPVDDVRMWRRALTVDEIKAIYNFGDGTEVADPLIATGIYPVLKPSIVRGVSEWQVYH